jgi:putative ABC transport system permease protein
MLGYENPEKALGHQLFFRDSFYKIVGIVEDYHHMSLKQSPVPLLYYLDETCNDYFVLKTGSENMDKTLKMAELKWKQFFPGNPFDYFFLEDFYGKQYKADKDFRNILGYFSGVAFFIAGLGLFTLSSFIIKQRKKKSAYAK